MSVQGFSLGSDRVKWLLLSHAARFLIFFSVVISVWTVMHAYVLVRLLSLRSIIFFIPRSSLFVLFTFLWASYLLGRILFSRWPTVAFPLELIGSVWMGFLFLLVVWFFAADLLTGFGCLWTAAVTPARLSAVGIALLLSLFGIVQVLRGPVVRHEEISLANLPAEQAGLKVVHLSDVHLDVLIGRHWLERRLKQIQELKPDLLFFNGDILDDIAQGKKLLPTLSKFSARLGVFAVTGNHEFYAGFHDSHEIFEAAGFTVLKDEAKEIAPGLVVAGVDDLVTRNRLGLRGDPIEKALKNRPFGTTLYLSHTPVRVEEAAEAGVDLMLSGHTHGGQIWPFNVLVWSRYGYVEGRYDIGKMILWVSRGTGFWGPPFRLFHRSEILVLTLRRSEF